ncbi:Hcp family type VI secretion system effector [Elioraea rosea]|uniref:Hcp family type VI secretion system effector n=1 Tax=Elioraea rosea TaxID=2492390 RepID=UPI001185AB36|nr:type VI secretion system tube protein Hcp [Elioraea rosea]
MPIFMKFAGIDGSATSKGYEGWIQVESISLGVGRGITTFTGGAANREASAPSVSDVVVTKLMDRASPKLFEEGLVGSDGKLVTIVVTRTGKELRPFCLFTFFNTLVSGYSVSSSGDTPDESLSLNFTRMEYSFTGSETTGKDASQMKVGFDIATATTM